MILFRRLWFVLNAADMVSTFDAGGLEDELESDEMNDTLYVGC